MFKELGKKTTRNLGRWVTLEAARRSGSQRKFISRLFIKNTGPCKSESL